MITDDSDYSLAAAIRTEDHRQAIALAEHIDADTIYLSNTFNACALFPVGGFKQSGYGRENGWPGMMGYLQTESIWLSTAGNTPRPFGS